ncbi:beta-lactamase regulating signal transducer with metallopeptidase domain [Luteibacter sp. Sphag1AF]|uniref:M56 family metallopeptidase n=1 Tax=Luteibacter sp. Sphag1AF TaxID=2587031 RepID=UPI00160EA6C0|nr:M56 family metallopeptidase [Luteibacter sp. Sphag1AF]MBB3225772.1 beta-lactamase regulating signal transducer with metallopeptidase domain [Luteibacter sp. Sphag1AF]
MDAMAETLLQRLAYASVQACVLSALIFVVMRCVPRLSAATRALLWWLVGLQLIIGLAGAPGWSLPLLKPAIQGAAVTSLITTFAPAAGDVVPPVVAEPAASLSWAAWLMLAWALVVAAQCVVAFVQWRRVRGCVARAMPHDDIRIETLVSQRARRLGMRRSPALLCSDEVTSPQVVGVLRPAILLPTEHTLGDDELEMALLHELAHVRRGDLWLGWIPAAARALFFFHPLAHLAAREYGLSREAACDAEVIGRGRQVPQAYGRLLVRLGVSPETRHALGGASPTFATLKRRLTMLGQVHDTSSRALAWTLVAVVAVAGVAPWRVVASTQDTVPTVNAVPPVPDVAPVRPVAPVASIASVAPMAPMASLPPPPPPPAPMAPMAPDVAPARPARPAMPPPLGGTYTHSVVTLNDDTNTAYVLMDGHSMFMSGSTRDAEHATRQRKGDEALLWFRRGDSEWVVRDPAYVRRVQSAFASVNDLSGKQQSLADKQRDIGEKQRMIGQQQAAIGHAQARLSATQAELSYRASDPNQPDVAIAMQAEQKKIGDEQRKVGEQQRALGLQQAELGKQQAALGQQQREAAQKAQQNVQRVLDEALRDHVAQAAR